MVAGVGVMKQKRSAFALILWQRGVRVCWEDRAT